MKISQHIKDQFYLYGLLIFGFFIRLVYIFSFTTPEKYLSSDPWGYDTRALQMAMGKHADFSTYWPPLFHIFLSLIYRPILWLGLAAFRIKIDIIIFALFYIIGFWCIYKIAEKLFSKKIALIILIALILWYPFIFLNYLVMSENLFFPLLFLGLYILIVKPIKPSTGIWLGILWGLAFLARPIFAFVIPLFLFWGIYYKINWKFLLNFAITVAVIIASMMAFNSYYTNGAEKSVSSNGGVGFAMLWCDAKSIEFTAEYSFGFGPPANIEYPESKKIFTKIPFENQKYYYQMGLACLKQHPERLVTNFTSIIKIFYSHLFPTIGDIIWWENLRQLFRFITGILFIGSLISIIGLAKNWFYVDKALKKYLILFTLIISSLLATVYLQNVGEERYIIPYIPFLIFLNIPIFIFLSKKNFSSYNKDYKKNNLITLSVLIISSLIIRFALFNFQSGDYIYCLTHWYDFIKLMGLRSLKYNFSDYSPSYLYGIWLVAHLPIAKLYAIKLLSVVFDFVLAFFVLLIVNKKYPNNRFISIISFGAIIFAPTVIINSAYWGQSDAIYTAFLVASVYFLLKNKPFWCLFFYGISFALKLQAIFLLPLLVILFLKKKIKLWHFVNIPLIYIATILPAALFGRSWKDLLLIYFSQAKNYNSLTLNAPSLYQWFPQNKFNPFYIPGLISAIAIIIIFIFVIYKNKKEITNDIVIKISFLSVIIVPFLLPKMHDRYFFPADVFSIIFAFYFPELFFLPILMQIISFLSYGPFLWNELPNFPLLSSLVLIIILIAIFDFLEEDKIKNFLKKLSIKFYTSPN